MMFDAADTLYLALALYSLGTLIALGSLFTPDRRPQHVALIVMIGGFAVHTFWIGVICTRTGHPPLTNLPELAAFLSWTIFAVELGLYIRYRVYAAAFFVYPLVLLLLTVPAVLGEPFTHMDPSLRSGLFTAHILFSTLGIAGLLIGLAFTLLTFMQDRALRSKKRGRLWQWIPSLDVCRSLSYRLLAIGFSVYTLGLIAGAMWSYRTTAGIIAMHTKEMSAVIAWVLFAALLQTFISGAFRGKRTLYISGAAYVAIIVAILGIAHA